MTSHFMVGDAKNSSVERLKMMFVNRRDVRLFSLALSAVFLLLGTSETGVAQGNEKKEDRREERREEKREREKDVKDTPAEDGRYDSVTSTMPGAESNNRNETAERTANRNEDISWEQKNPNRVRERDQLLSGWGAIRKKQENGESLNRQEQQVVESLNEIATEQRNHYESTAGAIGGPQYDIVQGARQRTAADRYREATAQRERDAREQEGRDAAQRESQAQEQLRQQEYYQRHQNDFRTGQMAEFTVGQFDNNRSTNQPSREMRSQANEYRQGRETLQRQQQFSAQSRATGQGAYPGRPASQVPSSQRRPPFRR